MESKVCRVCNTEKNVSDFPLIGKSYPGKTESRCKKCKNEYTKEWKEKNKEKFKKYKDDNKQRIREYNKKYWQENKEKQKEKVAIWRKENAQHIRDYRKANRDRDREKARLWARTENGNALRRTTTHRYRSKKKRVASDLTAEQWLQIKSDFNDCCAYCGIGNVTLHQEHFIPVSKGGPLSQTNILPSCPTCNNRKSNKDFFEWYKTHDHYSVENERHIVEYLNNKGANIEYGIKLQQERTGFTYERYGYKN